MGTEAMNNTPATPGNGGRNGDGPRGSERARTGPAKSEPSRNEPLYDEALVPPYSLPDPLRCDDGTMVTDAHTWRAIRRPQLLAKFEAHVYGTTPSAGIRMSHEVVDEDRPVLAVEAVRRQVRLTLSASSAHRNVDILMYLPAPKASSPHRVPVFLGLNFGGNHTVSPDPAIRLPGSTLPKRGNLGAGFGLATAYCGDFEPDEPGRHAEGIRGLFMAAEDLASVPRGGWGAVGAWAWGLSRILDYLEQDETVDAGRVIVIGHSRLGKAALWAGAQDERFAMVVSNDSGCTGAALSRRCFGETVERINTSFPHWFCDAYKRYNGREAELPVDQHMLLALAAPRPLYVASAQEDRWADPKGEFLATVEADRVYRKLYGEGLPSAENLENPQMPGVDHPIHGRVGYHVRSDGHDLTSYDWDQYLRFARRHLG